MSSASGRNAGNVAWNAAAEAECRARFMVLFDKGYAHYFDFLGGRTSSKGKARLRCRICGHEFEKFGSFAQQDVNIYCPRCHVHRDDEVTVPTDGHLVERMAGMYSDGMSTAEIEAATGIQKRYVSKLLKEHGIELGTNRIGKAKKEQRAALRESRQEARRAILSGFNELSNEIREDGSCKALKAATNRVGGYSKRFVKTAEHIERYAPTIEVCDHCGKSYVFFPSSRRYGRKKASRYCSDLCRARANRANSDIGHRLRKHGSGDKPRDSIKLDEVIERDNGICYICGCRTSKDDHYYRRGWFTVGDSYPTIDHVYPIARGGTHTWDNVRLACHRCNSEKRDSVA